MKRGIMLGNVYVKNEFAPLKRVVVAESEFGFPMTMELRNETFIPDEAKEYFRKEELFGKDHADILPSRQRAWEQERENLKSVLKKYGVEVQQPRKLTVIEKEMAKESGFSNYFIRDPFFVIGNLMIEGTLKPFYRRDEVLTAREILEKEANENRSIYVAAPSPDTLEEGPFLEGGDILVLNKTIFVGQSGMATNQKGIEWLKQFVSNFGFEVVEVPLHPEILHLDCAINFVRDGLMVVCEEALLNGIPEELKDWDKIYASLEEAKALAVNGLPINEQVYIADPEFESIGHQIEERDIHVEYVDFSISRQFGGSFRCSTQPLLRM